MSKKITTIVATLALIVAIGVAISVQKISSKIDTLTRVSQQSEAVGAAGTRFPHGVSVGSLSSPTANELIIGNTGTTTVATQGVPTYYTLGGVDYAEVQQTFTSATNTPIIIRSPFASATTTFGFNGIQVQITTGGPAIEFDIATTSLSNFATTTSVLVKDIAVTTGATYDGTFYPMGTTTPIMGGALPGVNNGTNHQGETYWFLRPSEGLMLKIASSSVAGSVTGTVSATFKKP